MLAKIKHENVVRLHEVIDSRSHVHLVMELCEGKTLDHLVKKDQANGGIPEARALCRALRLHRIACQTKLHL